MNQNLRFLLFACCLCACLCMFMLFMHASQTRMSPRNIKKLGHGVTMSEICASEWGIYTCSTIAND